MTEINGNLHGVSSVHNAATISILRDLIYMLRSNEFAKIHFLEMIGKFESQLDLYVTEIKGARTVMRFGNGHEVTLVNHGFRDEFRSEEWYSYLLGRRRTTIEIFEKMLAQLVADNSVNSNRL